MHPLLRQIIGGATPSPDSLLDALAPTLPLLERLAETGQDAEWHAEGDVRIHTRRVLEETYALLAGPASHLSPERRLVLVLAALLHDIAKPLVTQVREVDERSRVVAPHHAERGRSYLAYRLPMLGLPYPLVREVMAVVGHHHDPKQWVRRDKPAHAYRHLARLADLELLYFLELADMRGRECADQARQVEYIELFRLFAEEYEVWGVPRDALYTPWQAEIEALLPNHDAATHAWVLACAIRDAEAGEIFTPHEAVARCYPHLAAFPQLVVLCGPSGVGKSTWAASHLPDHELISLDALRDELAGDRSHQGLNGQVVQAAREALREHLRRRRRVVWDATNLRRVHRASVAQLGFDYHAHVTFAIFHSTEQACFRANDARDHAVPHDVLRAQLDHLEWPTAAEAHALRFVDGE